MDMMNTTNHTRANDIPEAQGFIRRIGRTTYKVQVHFSATSKENMEDKILRLIRHDAEKIYK